MTKIFNNFLVRSKRVHGDKYDYSKVIYKNNRTAVTIVCNTHGDFSQIPFVHYEQKSGCPKCYSKTYPMNTEEFIRRAVEYHGNKYDYSKVDYKNNRTPITIICIEHGEFTQLPFGHLAGQRCRKCYNDTQGGELADILLEFKKVHGDRYDYSKIEYIRKTEKVVMVCRKHGNFKQSPAKHITGQGCPKCVINKPVSKSEIAFLDYLKIRPENRQYTISPTNYQVDGVCPETKTIYEFLGDYWHGNPKIHSSEIKIRGRTNRTCGDAHKETFGRFDELKSLGYNIKYIWESEWKTLKKYGDNIPLTEYKK